MPFDEPARLGLAAVNADVEVLEVGRAQATKLPLAEAEPLPQLAGLRLEPEADVAVADVELNQTTVVANAPAALSVLAIMVPNLIGLPPLTFSQQPLTFRW